VPEAIVRRGKLRVTGAVLESSLTVEEAHRMLQVLAAEGHLEVSLEHGRLHYTLWSHAAPLLEVLVTNKLVDY
jgi:hypothetical protein